MNRVVSSPETRPAKRTSRLVSLYPPHPPRPHSSPFGPSVMRRRKGDGEKRELTGERTEQRSGEEEKKEAFDRAVWRPRVNGPVKGSHCLAATSIWYCTLLFLEHCLQPQCLLSLPLPLSLKEIGGLGPTVRGGVGGWWWWLCRGCRCRCCVPRLPTIVTPHVHRGKKAGTPSPRAVVFCHRCH